MIDTVLKKRPPYFVTPEEHTKALETLEDIKEDIIRMAMIERRLMNCAA